jgi:acyl dehydratase
MPISAAAAGRDAGFLEADASARRLMAYAAGIGATDERYFDDEHGLVAHPAFCVSLEWPVVSGPGYLAAIGRSADAPRGAVHVLQDSRFHRLIRAEETLLTRARIAQVRQTSAGVLVTSRVETFVKGASTPAVTTWTSAMFLGDKLEGAPASIEDEPPALRKDADVTAASPQRLAIETSPGLAHRYSECASIWNPIHTERRAARAIGLPGIILHGTCTWALAGQALIQAVADGDPRRLRRLAGRFKGMVLPGDRLELEFGREAGGDASGSWQFAVRTPRGDLAITHGVAEIGP